MIIQSLPQLISLVESNGNPFAMRHEPKFRVSPAPAKKLRNEIKCSISTADSICRTSWGSYQIMGSNLVSMGFLMWPGAFMENDVTQETAFKLYLDRNRINYSLDEILNDTAKRERFSRLYNGPGNIKAYSARLLEIYKAHSK